MLRATPQVLAACCQMSAAINRRLKARCAANKSPLTVAVCAAYGGGRRRLMSVRGSLGLLVQMYFKKWVLLNKSGV